MMSEATEARAAHDAEIKRSLAQMTPEHRKEFKEEVRESRIVMAELSRAKILADDSGREEDEAFYREARDAVLRSTRATGWSVEETRVQYPLLFSTWEERRRHHELGMILEDDPRALRRNILVEYRCRTRGCRLGGVLQVPDGLYWFHMSRFTLTPAVGTDVLTLLQREDVPHPLRERLEACVYAEAMADAYQPRALSEARWMADRLDDYHGAIEGVRRTCSAMPLTYRSGTVDPAPYLQCPHVEAEVSPERAVEDLQKVRGKRSPVVRL